MTPRLLSALLALVCISAIAADDYKPGPDSMPQPGVVRGEMIKDTYLAKDGSVFPGTEREYQIYIPAGLDKTKPAPFMVFQDGVIYQAPAVFDNLIAKKEIPAMIGIFIKPGVVPAANANALPRFNRSYEYDSITDSYASFLIDEFLPAIKAKHQLNLSDDPNARAIVGNSSGGICAFMVGWHRPDQFRRIFTGVGTYVGIHGADQLPVLVRKFEPKPLRVYLQSGENDNNLYCGDWWMANQTMERSLTWNGYDVNHTWGTGGHNAKHATAIFPDVLRWLWKGYPDEPVKTNPRGDAKWVGGQVVGDGEWAIAHHEPLPKDYDSVLQPHLVPMADGSVFIAKNHGPKEGTSELVKLDVQGRASSLVLPCENIAHFTVGPDGQFRVFVAGNNRPDKHSVIMSITTEGKKTHETALITQDPDAGADHANAMCCAHDGRVFFTDWGNALIGWLDTDGRYRFLHNRDSEFAFGSGMLLCLSPDQTQLYMASPHAEPTIDVLQLNDTDPVLRHGQVYFKLEQLPMKELRYPNLDATGLCVDSNGWLYAATSYGIQVLDQAGRVNFILPTPQQPHDVCFGGKDLSDLFISCGDTIYKRHTKAHGYVSGQMAPIKPPGPKL